jgi:hypothetical protein
MWERDKDNAKGIGVVNFFGKFLPLGDLKNWKFLNFFWKNIIEPKNAILFGKFAKLLKPQYWVFKKTLRYGGNFERLIQK